MKKASSKMVKSKLSNTTAVVDLTAGNDDEKEGKMMDTFSTTVIDLTRDDAEENRMPAACGGRCFAIDLTREDSKETRQTISWAAKVVRHRPVAHQETKKMKRETRQKSKRGRKRRCNVENAHCGKKRRHRGNPMVGEEDFGCCCGPPMIERKFPTWKPGRPWPSGGYRNTSFLFADTPPHIFTCTHLR
mmetsp:Transcript_19295/g.41491  ORF Transcript_19295/g.41491 Transcript_19295/m.41491 type:complete len:189 (-) Transcript_19295:50-616(-)